MKEVDEKKQARQSQKKRPVRNLWSPDYKELTDKPVTTEDASANSHMLQNLSLVFPIIHLIPESLSGFLTLL